MTESSTSARKPGRDFTSFEEANTMQNREKEQDNDNPAKKAKIRIEDAKCKPE